MRRIALALFAAALISAPAYAQSDAGKSDEQMLKKGAGQEQSTTSSKERGEAQKTEESKTRVEGGARVGVETREKSRVSIRGRTETSEEPVSVRRRSVTIEEEPEERQTIVKRKKAKKVAVRSKRPRAQLVVRGSRKRYVEEPSVRVSTSVRRTQKANVSVEQRRESERSNVKVSTERKSSESEATGSVAKKTGEASTTETKGSPEKLRKKPEEGTSSGAAK